jgi:hypothetical protein
MATVTLTLTGDKELSAMFQQFPDKVQRALIRSELRGVLKPVLARAKARARKKSGAMARTLKIRAMKRKRGRVGYYIQTGTRAELQAALTKQGASLAGKVLGGGRYTKKTRRTLQVIGRQLRQLQRPRVKGRKDHYYPAIIELGTKKGNHPAYPYLRSSFDERKEQMANDIIQALNEAVEEATRT